MTVQSRRVLFSILVVTTMVSLTAMMVYSLSYRGISLAEGILLTCFVVTLPWTIIGFWNAVTGFIILRREKDPAKFVFPGLGSISGNEEITASTAVAMCIRNEDVDQVARNLNAMIARLVSSGNADKFHVYVLSDSSFEDVIEAEERVFDQLEKDWSGSMAVTYRRRESNPGFKAGNIRDFCERWGHQHDFMLTLDADSVMSASSILRMVRLMQKDEKLGILQSLVVGLPSASGFTRVFQFGMRLGMKSYTIGSAWWQADCGPYWGHNALIRMKPFIEHCHLPKLPGNGPLSGWILSHDQVEAVYMRRAGYECRVLAEEGGSYEENPPHILEFIRRDLRWCHGNMQYFKLLREPGLYMTSRIQLMLAILMFTGAPAWMVFVVVATAGFVTDVGIHMQAVGPGYTLFAIIMLMIFAPKISSFFDALLNPELRKRFGGGPAMVFSAISEVLFSVMISPIMAIANTIFLFKLFVLRKPKNWLAQARGVEAVPFGKALFHLWPQMLFGAVGFYVVLGSGWYSIGLLFLCLPVFVGPLLAVPFAMSSSLPFSGWISAKYGVWQIPEEEEPTVVLRALDLPALAIRETSARQTLKYAPLSRDELLAIDVDAENIGGLKTEPVHVAA